MSKRIVLFTAGFSDGQNGNNFWSRLVDSRTHRQNYGCHRCRNSLPGCFHLERVTEKVLRLDSRLNGSSLQGQFYVECKNCYLLNPCNCLTWCHFVFQGLLPMQLMIQIPSDRFNRCILAEAQEADVMIRVDRSGSLSTLRLTSYEWNARKLKFCDLICLFRIIFHGNFLFLFKEICLNCCDAVWSCQTIRRSFRVCRQFGSSSSISPAILSVNIPLF